MIHYKQSYLLLPLPDIPNHHLCPVTALKHMFSISPSQQRSDLIFTYLTPLGLRPLKHNQFIKDLKSVLSRKSNGQLLFEPKT